ncbi:MAG: hypothetical protein HY000_20400 [Planctomycetes bacterium]|nr:hypothetical protein [Planctomycetota bacterium]
MKIQRLLEHHGIRCNPFADEDAQTDQVFKEHCIDSTHHPAWDKIFGDAVEPATSIVFGEKGAGKTALRLQIAREVGRYNAKHSDRRVFVIEYDDFNPFLDRFRDRMHGRRRRPERVLQEWRLWDHMDAILSLGVTRLVDMVLKPASDGETVDVAPLDRIQSRDLLLLAACYDQSPAESFKSRWKRLRRKLRFRNWWAQLDLAGAWIATIAIVGYILVQQYQWLATPWPYLLILAAWLPWLWRAMNRLRAAWGMRRQARVVNHEINALRQVLMSFPTQDLAGQPLPNKDRTDDRYELLVKFQNVLRTLGYHGIFVLVDRVDEPHLINGSTEQMRAMLWPMLDNKFLKHPGIGFKLLLPIELSYYLDREDRDFHQRARLDKQNLIPTLDWTGEALYDVANDRLQACAMPGRSPKLRDLFAESVTDRRLIDALRGLRVPRHLFKFLHRALVAQANAHRDDEPVWHIPNEMFEATLALYQRDQDSVDRGLRAG